MKSVVYKLYEDYLKELQNLPKNSIIEDKVCGKISVKEEIKRIKRHLKTLDKQEC